MLVVERAMILRCAVAAQDGSLGLACVNNVVRLANDAAAAAAFATESLRQSLCDSVPVAESRR